MLFERLALTNSFKMLEALWMNCQPSLWMLLQSQVNSNYIIQDSFFLNLLLVFILSAPVTCFSIFVAGMSAEENNKKYKQTITLQAFVTEVSFRICATVRCKIEGIKIYIWKIKFFPSQSPPLTEKASLILLMQNTFIN